MRNSGPNCRLDERYSKVERCMVGIDSPKGARQVGWCLENIDAWLELRLRFTDSYTDRSE